MAKVSRRLRVVAGGMLLFVVLTAVGAGSESSPVSDNAKLDTTADATISSTILNGMTAPRQQATLAALQRGRIEQVMVVEGQNVPQGELLVVLDEDVQQANVSIAQARAECVLDIEQARVRMEEAGRELERVMKLSLENAASQQEVNETRLLAEVTRIEHQLAYFQRIQARNEFQRQKLLLDQYRINAPFAGYVSVVFKHSGESVDELEKIMTLVQLDPLEIILDCPIHLAHLVQTGDRMEVRPLDPHWSPKMGEVVWASRVADAASQTFKVKMIVENKDAGWMSGLKIQIDLSKRQSGLATTRPADSDQRSASGCFLNMALARGLADTQPGE